MPPPATDTPGSSAERRAHAVAPSTTAAQAEAKAAFLLRLRARGIRDLAVLRAVEAVPRSLFVPHRYADLAARDVALPIPCGQTMSEPFIAARMVEALSVTPSSRVLEIGAGSGYVTAVLARLAASVAAVERYQALAVYARARLSALGLGNANVFWADGAALEDSFGRFDRLMIHARVDDLPPSVAACLEPGFIAVFARPGPGKTGQVLVRRRSEPSGRVVDEVILPSRLRPLDEGLSQGL